MGGEEGEGGGEGEVGVSGGKRDEGKGGGEVVELGGWKVSWGIVKGLD